MLALQLPDVYLMQKIYVITLCRLLAKYWHNSKQTNGSEQLFLTNLQMHLPKM